MMMEKESNSKNGGENGEGNERVRTAETLMRVVPMGLCLTALVVMLRNSESNDYGSLSYSDLGAFRSPFSFLTHLTHASDRIRTGGMKSNRSHFHCNLYRVHP